MRAMMRESYGTADVLELRQVGRPRVRDRDLLIRVIAASVNRSDWEVLTGKPLYARLNGQRRPKNPLVGLPSLRPCRPGGRLVAESTLRRVHNRSSCDAVSTPK